MHPMISKKVVLAASIAFTASAWSSTARAATFLVDNTSDPVVGTCSTAGACTLRQAIIEAAATAGRDVITFDPAVFNPGAPAWIAVESPLPIVADPAGTVIDATGAGVRIVSYIEAGEGNAPDGLVFASGSAAPLHDVALINVTVSGFEGSGVVVCGGTYPECDQDVVAPVFRRVTAHWNGSMGILVQGQNVTKPRIEESVAADNGSVGMLVNGFRTIAGTRIARSAVKANAFGGIWVGPLTETITDLAITDTSASGGLGGILATAFEAVSKVTFTNVAVSGAEGGGIFIETTALSAVSVANVVSTRNEDAGLFVTADTIKGLVLRDVATNVNKHGILVQAGEVVGAKITRVTAAGNTANGITLAHLTGAKISRVASVGNGVQGLVLRGTGNQLKQVRVAENIGDGIRLAGPGGGNRLDDVSTTANQGAGIYVDADNLGNKLKGNVALGSDSIDLFDANAGCGTNTWKSNVFERRNEPCIR